MQYHIVTKPDVMSILYITVCVCILNNDLVKIKFQIQIHVPKIFPTSSIYHRPQRATAEELKHFSHQNKWRNKNKDIYSYIKEKHCNTWNILLSKEQKTWKCCHFLELSYKPNCRKKIFLVWGMWQLIHISLCLGKRLGLAGIWPTLEF